MRGCGGGGAASQRGSGPRCSGRADRVRGRRFRLDREIDDFVRYTDRVVAKLLPAVQEAQRLVEAAVVATWPTAQMHTYGSLSTNLWLPTSDVDMVVQVGCSAQPGPPAAPATGVAVTSVTDPPQHPDLKGAQDSTAAAASLLLGLTDELCTREWVAGVHLVPSARIPVLKLVISHHGSPFVNVDVTMAALHQDAADSAQDGGGGGGKDAAAPGGSLEHTGLHAGCDAARAVPPVARTARGGRRDATRTAALPAPTSAPSRRSIGTCGRWSCC